jgi:hypothetical protein
MSSRARAAGRHPDLRRHIVAGFLVNGPERGGDPRDSVFGSEDRWSSLSRAAGGWGR